MGVETGIAWTDHTANFWWGCEKVSPGCKHCYAETLADKRGKHLFGSDKLWRGERRQTKGVWAEVVKWNAAAIKAGRRARVFTNSMADFFDDHPDVALWRQRAWGLIHDCRALDWQILTKRPQNVERMLPPGWGRGWSHVWLGTSAENQKYASERIPILAAIPARVRFVSYEPALELVNFAPVNGIDWIIYGGESGPGRRPDETSWALQTAEYCDSYGVAFFYKQSSASRSGWQHPSLAHLPRQFPETALPLHEVKP